MALRTRWVPVILVAAAIFLIALNAWSQSSETPPVEATPETALGPIPVGDLPIKGAETTSLITDTRHRLRADSSLLAIRGLIPSGEQRIAALDARTKGVLPASPTLRQLRNLRSDWQRLREQFKQWRGPIGNRIAEIGKEIDNLVRLMETWQITAGRAAKERLPGEVIADINRTLSDLEDTGNMLYGHRNDLLMLEYEVTDLVARCEIGMFATSTEAERLRAKLLVTDAAPLWSRDAVSEADAQFGLKVRSIVGDYYQSLAYYVNAELPRVVGHIVFYVVALLCIALLGRYARARSDHDEAMAGSVIVLGHPAAAAIVVSVLASLLFHPKRPESFVLVRNLLLLIPLLAIIPHLLPRRFKPAVHALAVIYVADFVFVLLPQHSFTGRILKLGIRLAIIVTAFWLLRSMFGPSRRAAGGRRHRLAALVLAVTICIIAVSTVADLGGNVGLADVLFEGTIESIYLGLLTWLAVVVLSALVIVMLKTGVASRTNLVRRYGESLRLGILRAIKTAGFFIWLLVALDSFKALEPTYEAVKEALASTLKVGSLEIATGDIVLFLVIVWLSLLISRIIGAVLREEVYPRVGLPRGIPMAVSKLTQFVIVLVGFFVAMGAAGIDLSRFTLLAGALGVGIGFGLQNVVNNLVSGVFIVLERPVKVGDKVRIGQNEGEIKRVGLRATVIRTWEGAEVMVPNSHLILDEVTNWTLSDQQRRIEIRVGVAYGSDTDKVSEVLLTAAKDHKDVLEHPEPYVLFKNFGDSSLNFSLRAWIGHFGDFLRVRSELHAAVNKALAEAGITIPFPQRDIHLPPGGERPRPSSRDKED
jgi:small-conductance mechanosensitive channel